MAARATRVLKWGVGTAVAASGVGAAAFVHEFGADSFDRLLHVYSLTIPAFFDYKRVQYLHKKLPNFLGQPVDESRLAAEYDELHVKWAPRMLDACFELRGFYLKGGQMVAGNYGGSFPRIWSKVFERCLDQQPPHPFEEVAATLRTEMGIADLSEMFSYIDPQPLGSASIGQVHRAVLKSTGQHVVVKVQHPHVERRFRGDVTVTKWFYHVAMPEQVGLLNEVEKQFVNEFDYQREAAQLQRVHHDLAGRFPNVIVPRPLSHLCTKRVLIMEEVQRGVKLTTALEADFDAIAAAKGPGVTRQQLIDEEHRLNEAALARGELRCGPTAAEFERLLTALRWQNRLAWWLGRKPMYVPLNHAALVDELLHVHGHMVLIAGAFSGDPHPGNLLAIRREDGDIDSPGLALIDFGQLKVLPPERRLQAARMFAALSRADASNAAHKQRIMNLARDMGFDTKYRKPDVVFKLLSLVFDRDDALALGGLNIMEVAEDLGKQDPITSWGDDFVLIVRAGTMLRGLGHILNQHRSLATAWRPYADAVMRQAGEDPDRVLELA